MCVVLQKQFCFPKQFMDKAGVSGPVLGSSSVSRNCILDKAGVSGAREQFCIFGQSWSLDKPLVSGARSKSGA